MFFPHSFHTSLVIHLPYHILDFLIVPFLIHKVYFFDFIALVVDPEDVFIILSFLLDIESVPFINCFLSSTFHDISESCFDVEVLLVGSPSRREEPTQLYEPGAVAEDGSTQEHRSRG